MTERSEHTQGPWIMDADLARHQDGQWDRVISGANGEVVALVTAQTGDGAGDPVPDDERDANARLIAAALDLLAALEIVEADPRTAQSSRIAARAAIRKARGEG